MRRPLPPELNRVTGSILDSAFQVHRALGPGLLESVYELCLAAELRHRGIQFERQVGLPIRYRELEIESGLRLDFLVEGSVVVELKAIEVVTSVHKAQLLSYLKLADKPVGMLINFNVAVLRDGVDRIINPMRGDYPAEGDLRDSTV